MWPVREKDSKQTNRVELGTKTKNQNVPLSTAHMPQCWSNMDGNSMFSRQAAAQWDPQNAINFILITAADYSNILWSLTMPINQGINHGQPQHKRVWCLKFDVWLNRDNWKCQWKRMNVNNSLIEFSSELCLLHFEQGWRPKQALTRLIGIAHTSCDVRQKRGGAEEWAERAA